MRLFIKKTIMASIFSGALLTANLALAQLQVNNPCILGSGTCSANINEVIVVGKGLADLAWTGNDIKSGSAYICNVVYLNPQDQGFIAQSGYWGTLLASVDLTMGTWFTATATQSYHIGFKVDGTKATGPTDQSGGPQVSLVCYSTIALNTIVE